MGEVGVYILWRHNIVNQYIVTRSILELCMDTERRLGFLGVQKVVVTSGERPFGVV